MPELPEVETVARGLRLPLEGQRLAEVEVRVPALRWPLPRGLARRLTGRQVLSVGRRAKYLLIALDRDEVLLAHLGMSGRILLVPAGEERAPEPHDHIVLRTEAGSEIRFNDARRFGMVDLVPQPALEEHRLLAGLGPEPLGNAFSGPMLAAALEGKATPIKAALLDQRVVAGLGNIYVSEALFEAGIAPRRLARSVQGERAERLARAIKSVLHRAIAAGGSSLRDYVQTSGELGYFQHQWAVYGKEGEPCPGCTCGKGVRRMVQSGRSTFYCAVRQR
jgi:formamidopyrimidine-DNA glycosylase